MYETFRKKVVKEENDPYNIFYFAFGPCSFVLVCAKLVYIGIYPYDT